jgi:hypothetical protein
MYKEKMEMPRNLFHVEQFKAKAPCSRKKAVHFFPGATGIRRAGEKVAL